MKKQFLVVGLLVLAGMPDDLLACGDKFLVISRGTRFQRAAVARKPANILVYANPSSTLSTALAKANVDDTLRKAGYRPTSISVSTDLDQALRKGDWDLVLADLGDSAALRTRLQGSAAPMLVPIAYNATGNEIAQAKKDYQRVIRGPFKSQAFLEAIDDVLALREKLRARTL